MAGSLKFEISHILQRFFVTFFLVVLSFNSSPVSLYWILVESIVPIAFKILFGFLILVVHLYLFNRARSLIGIVGIFVIFSFLFIFFIAAIPLFYPTISYFEFIAFWLSVSLSVVYVTGQCYSAFDNLVSGIIHTELTH